MIDVDPLEMSLFILFRFLCAQRQTNQPLSWMSPPVSVIFTALWLPTLKAINRDVPPWMLRLKSVKERLERGWWCWQGFRSFFFVFLINLSTAENCARNSTLSFSGQDITVKRWCGCMHPSIFDDAVWKLCLYFNFTVFRVFGKKISGYKDVRIQPPVH